ncbi:hypothetical protein E2C01_018677 [Portunus trituberculatus]|uniref:Uncharacterized protein n=1 Tax=Portunus trituberculatus TaxID=210409 RepID=A0A5B7DWU5_PORTR|nr:hypothetical protein [Portunus trituberculatus]
MREGSAPWHTVRCVSAGPQHCYAVIGVLGCQSVGVSGCRAQAVPSISRVFVRSVECPREGLPSGSLQCEGVAPTTPRAPPSRGAAHRQYSRSTALPCCSHQPGNNCSSCSTTKLDRSSDVARARSVCMCVCVCVCACVHVCVHVHVHASQSVPLTAATCGSGSRGGVGRVATRLLFPKQSVAAPHLMAAAAVIMILGVNQAVLLASPWRCQAALLRPAWCRLHQAPSCNTGCGPDAPLCLPPQHQESMPPPPTVGVWWYTAHHHTPAVAAATAAAQRGTWHTPPLVHCSTPCTAVSALVHHESTAPGLLHHTQYNTAQWCSTTQQHSAARRPWAQHWECRAPQRWQRRRQYW